MSMIYSAIPSKLCTGGTCFSCYGMPCVMLLNHWQPDKGSALEEEGWGGTWIGAEQNGVGVGRLRRLGGRRMRIEPRKGAGLVAVVSIKS